MDGLRAYSHTVLEANKCAPCAKSFLDDVKIRANLLCPVSRNSSPYGKDAQRFLLANQFCIMFKIDISVILNFIFRSFFFLSSVKYSNVKAQFRICESRHIDGDAFFIRGFEHSPSFQMLIEILSNRIMNVDASNGLAEVQRV